MVDTVDTGTRMYLIMEDNNRVTHSVLDREDFVSNQSSLFDTCFITAQNYVYTPSYTDKKAHRRAFVHFDKILHDWLIKFANQEMFAVKIFELNHSVSYKTIC